MVARVSHESLGHMRCKWSDIRLANKGIPELLQAAVEDGDGALLDDSEGEAWVKLGAELYIVSYSTVRDFVLLETAGDLPSPERQFRQHASQFVL